MVQPAEGIGVLKSFCITKGVSRTYWGAGQTTVNPGIIRFTQTVLVFNIFVNPLPDHEGLRPSRDPLGSSLRSSPSVSLAPTMLRFAPHGD